MPARPLPKQLPLLERQTIVTGGEIVKRTLVAEENHLTIDLATQLQTPGDLAHFFANFFAADKDLAFTVFTTNTDTALTDALDHHIAIGIINKIARAKEVFNRGVNVVSESGLRDQGESGEK